MSTVLVVEDNLTILAMLEHTLQACGHATLLSSDAESALERISNERPDVVVCDVHLPGMNGSQFTQRVRSSPVLADTPVILMSAYDEPAGHAADAFVAKPLDPIELVELIERLGP